MEDKRQEDLDMINVINGIKNSSVQIYSKVARVFYIPRKKFPQLLVYILITTTLTATLFYTSRPYYAAYLTLAHNRLNNDYCSELITNLDTYINGDDNSALAKEISISKEDAKKIRSIEYKTHNLGLAKKYSDSVTVVLPFKVKVEVFDKSVLDTLQGALLAYLESNKIAAKLKAQDKEAFLRTEEKIQRELLEIDSLKKIVNQSIVPRGTGNGIILGEPIDPIRIYQKGMDLFDQQLRLKRKRENLDSFEVVVGFNLGAKKSSPPLLFYLLAGIIGGYILGLIFIKKTV